MALCSRNGGSIYPGRVALCRRTDGSAEPGIFIILFPILHAIAILVGGQLSCTRYGGIIMKRIMITDRLVSLFMAVSVFLTPFTGSKL